MFIFNFTLSSVYANMHLQQKSSEKRCSVVSTTLSKTVVIKSYL